MDVNVCALLENNGIYSKEKMPVIPKWQGPSVAGDAKFKSYSEETGILTLSGKNGIELTLVVDLRSRVLPAGTKLAEQKEGTEMYCSYFSGTDSPKMAGFVGVGLDLYSYWRPARGMWISATVLSVDREKWICTAQLRMPDEKEFRGLRFWEQAGEEAVFFDGNRNWTLPALKQNLEKPDREFRVHIDRATYLLLNGRFAGIEDLQKGDRLGIELKSPLRDDIRPNRVRAYRF